MTTTTTIDHCSSNVYNDDNNNCVNLNLPHSLLPTTLENFIAHHAVHSGTEVTKFTSRKITETPTSEPCRAAETPAARGVLLGPSGGETGNGMSRRRRRREIMGSG